ncbi:TetR/AcrR family transcriptional regulator [Gordonia neofelifaecis]|uniref:TetR-family protein transcriptional regulator n=1 Tax=Gordonia neofelifaecis NRRL B-59395 TaxID=644548 RepID=F1YEC6_9ACTN|nr:TetR/AcrR family transcriptional regulator [Gordonia neofelifaecis]EGD56759.1 TetR-family protein transcriptional regulator [Gordonia neofelifaecis NRRL B-59395]
MVGKTPRQQRYDERRRAILDAARLRADTDGWASVTTRHLAEAIGYTQPVLYGHFPGGKGEIMLVIALEGFAELAERCRKALCRTDAPGARIAAVATAYLDFGSAHPAVYEAMFQQVIDVKFASDDTPADLRAGFDVLADTIEDESRGVETEVFWAALHGISLLERAGRMRPEHREIRITELIDRYARG